VTHPGRFVIGETTAPSSGGTATCNGGCLCYSDEDACKAAGCPWNGTYCVNGSIGSDGGLQFWDAAGQLDAAQAEVCDAGCPCFGSQWRCIMFGCTWNGASCTDALPPPNLSVPSNMVGQ